MASSGCVMVFLQTKSFFMNNFYLKKVFPCDIISHSEMLESDAEFVDVPLRDVGQVNRKKKITWHKVFK